jgi:phosphatidylserine synthase 2
MWTVRYFKSKQYNWSGISEQPTLMAKAKRGLLQFTPHSWDNFDWHVFSSPKRLLQARGRSLHLSPCDGRHSRGC